MESGIGFRYGVIANKRYSLGDEVAWDGSNSRPASRPDVKVVKTIGYFNCDNMNCSSWQDCYPLVQLALITIAENRISEVVPYDGEASDDGFDIIEPQGLF